MSAFFLLSQFLMYWSEGREQMCCSAASYLRGIHLTERGCNLTCILAIFHSEEILGQLFE